MPFSNAEGERLRSLGEPERTQEYARYLLDMALSPKGSSERQDAEAKLSELAKLWGLTDEQERKLRRKIVRTLGRCAGIFR